MEGKPTTIYSNLDNHPQTGNTYQSPEKSPTTEHPADQSKHPDMDDKLKIAFQGGSTSPHGREAKNPIATIQRKSLQSFLQPHSVCDHAQTKPKMVHIATH